MFELFLCILRRIAGLVGQNCDLFSWFVNFMKTFMLTSSLPPPYLAFKIGSSIVY